MHYVRRYAGYIVALVVIWFAGYGLTQSRPSRIPPKNVQMKPTLSPGEWFTTEYGVPPQEFEHGDIVRYLYRHTGYNEDEVFLGRVVGFPGERVALRDGQLYRAEVGRPIDFERDAVQEVYLVSKSRDVKVDLQEILVPRGHFFLLTDQRDPIATRNITPHLLDSRHLGPIPTSLIIGRVEAN